MFVGVLGVRNIPGYKVTEGYLVRKVYLSPPRKGPVKNGKKETTVKESETMGSGV